MSTTSPIIEFKRVNKWYGEFHVLRDIDLQVATGERIVICGPSGSGKSTSMVGPCGMNSGNMNEAMNSTEISGTPRMSST